MHIWSINLQQRGQEYTLGKELLSVNALEINRSLYFKKKKKKDHQQAQSESHILKHPKIYHGLEFNLPPCIHGLAT